MEVLKTSNGVLKTVNGGIGRVNGGIEKGSMVALKRGIEKGNGHWIGSMGALVKVNGGIEKGQWGNWKGSMEALVRVNGGIEQWGLNGGYWKGWMGWGLNGGYWKGWMGALVRVDEKGQWCRWSHWEGSGQTGAWLWVRQGCGCGSDRSLSYRVLSSALQVCKLYLAGPQALPYRVVSSTMQGCKLYLAGL